MGGSAFLASSAGLASGFLASSAGGLVESAFGFSPATASLVGDLFTSAGGGFCAGGEFYAG